jgi:hypothetical protein
MKNFSLNHYEKAFANWLTDNHIRYIAVDERKRAAVGRSKVKSFDYLLYPNGYEVIVAEVKGKKFRGTSFARLKGFDCWVSTDDIDGLSWWQGVFGPSHIATFVFAYKIENVDVDFDGREIYEFDSNKYLFLAVRLEDYRAYMKTRSPKWKTLTLPADKFRQFAVPIHELLL